MACFWFLYEDYQNILAERSWIINIKRKDKGGTIKIVADESTININEQIKILNDLYIKHGIKNYVFTNFIVKEIISIKKIMIRCTFFFLAGYKKMRSICLDWIFDCMNHTVCFNKASKLNSICIAYCICYITTQIEEHENFTCYCFKCRVCRVLLCILTSRK